MLTARDPKTKDVERMLLQLLRSLLLSWTRLYSIVLAFAIYCITLLRTNSVRLLLQLVITLPSLSVHPHQRVHVVVVATRRLTFVRVFLEFVVSNFNAILTIRWDATFPRAFHEHQELLQPNTWSG